MAEVKKKAGVKPDLATFGGLVLALVGILGGLILEGGKIADVAQVTAALIVLGGSIGAVCVSTPLPLLIAAAKKMKVVFFSEAQDANSVVEQLITFATKARKTGLVSLEQDAAAVQDRFLAKALELAVDGADIQDVRKMLELEIEIEEHTIEAEAKVYEAAGGYSPTVGIIGAVLGLIQVMKHLEDIKEVGHGIAVAFVATVYGVGAANILFLPVAAKIKARGHERIMLKHLMLEGVLSIIEGMNPKLIRTKLAAFTQAHAKKPAKAKAAAAGKPAAA